MSEVVSIHSARRAAARRGSSSRIANRTRNARNGEALRTVQRGGRTFHVYASGEDRKVIELPQRKRPGSTSGETPAA